MKKTTWFMLSICLLVLVGSMPLLWPRLGRLLGKDVLYLAAVGPMTGIHQDKWQEMRQGIMLFLDHANEARLLPGTTLRLLERDDNNQARLATKVASELVDRPDVLLVFGHYADDTALAASDVYQKNGLPAITASARASTISQSNDWYFQMLPNSDFEGRFLASYIKHILHTSSLSIIYDDDHYGTSLMQGLSSAAHDMGLRLVKTWKFNTESDSLEERLQAIVAELLALPNPGVIFLATHEVEGVNIIKSINNPATSYTIIGSAEFATNTFIKEFNHYLQERIQPGYYSDRVYVVTPYLQDIAPENAQRFQETYRKAYHADPTWIAATYYDATRLAVEAIKLAEIDADIPLFKTRQKIRDALANLDEPEFAIQGVTGSLYFSPQGDIVRAPLIGRYTQQQLLPAYSQYQLTTTEPGQIATLQEILSATEAGQQLVSLGNGDLLKEVQVVDTGVDINEISHLDIRHARYVLDFYVWFRFRSEFKDFDDTSITFPNAVNAVSLGDPVFEKTTDDIIVRTYHVKGEFTSSFDLSAYPFEQPQLQIRFYHTMRPISNVRYVPDKVGMTRTEHVDHVLLNPLSGWKLKKVSSYQRLHYDQSSPKEADLPGAKPPTISSEFITNIHIARRGLSFSIKSLFPLAVLAVSLYMVYFIPVDQPGLRMLLCFAVFLINFAYQFQVRQRFAFPIEYILGIDYLTLTIYGLVLMAAMFAIVSYRYHTQARTTTVRVVTMSGRILHMIIIGLAVIFLTYLVVQHNGTVADSWLPWFPG